MADTTPTLREAAQQAQQALEKLLLAVDIDTVRMLVDDEPFDAARTTLDALRAALAEQTAEQAEPVAVPGELEKFEAWAKEYGRIFLAKKPKFGRDGVMYENQFTQEAWVGWQARASLAAAPPAPARQEWQPIETAPTDTEVLIGAWIDGEFKWGRSVRFYDSGNEREGEPACGWVWSIDDCSDSVAENPTHWQPLPAAPITAAPAEGGA